MNIDELKAEFDVVKAEIPSFASRIDLVLETARELTENRGYKDITLSLNRIEGECSMTVMFRDLVDDAKPSKPRALIVADTLMNRDFAAFIDGENMAIRNLDVNTLD